jgi:hypothetical protein
VRILTKCIWISLLVLLFTAFVSIPAFATDESDESDNSGEPGFEQEMNSDDNDFTTDDEGGLPLKEIDESAYIDIETSEVPLAQSPFPNSWAFLNLLMAIISLILSALTVITLLAGKNIRSDSTDEYGAYHAFNSGNTTLLKLIGTGIGAASVVFFLSTEDIHGVMRSVDEFTLPMALIIFTQIVIVSASFGIAGRPRGAGPPSA